MDHNDYTSPEVLALLEHLQNMYDYYIEQNLSSAAYTMFIEQSHIYISNMKFSIHEHEYYMVKDVHYDLLHQAFIKHFKNTQNS